MPVFPGVRRDPARPVRPSFRDPRFALLLAGQSLGWVCSWASGIVLWGFAAYHFGASPESISVTALCWSGRPWCSPRSPAVSPTGSGRGPC